MLLRSAIAGVCLGLLCLIAFFAVANCDLENGCTAPGWVSELHDGAMQRLFGSDDRDNRLKTKTIPPPPKDIAKPAEKPARQSASLPRERPTIPVESYDAGDQYEINAWNLVAFPSGSIDSVRAASGGAPVGGKLAAPRGDHLILAGWAGHRAYGMRFRNVLFSSCGKVVGGTAVASARPDVASAVHKNLRMSGWTAKIAIDHLPRCDAQVLRAWGVAPIGYNIFPLSGNIAIARAESATLSTKRYRASSSALTPAQNGKAALRKITVKASALRLRKCGGPTCDAVGRITAGQHNGFVLETAGEWSLLQVGESVGWASNKYLAIE